MPSPFRITAATPDADRLPARWPICNRSVSHHRAGALGSAFALTPPTESLSPTASQQRPSSCAVTTVRETGRIAAPCPAEHVSRQSETAWLGE